MKKISIILFAVSLLVYSCSSTDDVKPEDEVTASATMTYDGVTYTEFETNSLNMVSGIVSPKGTTGDGFLLSIVGVGADGTTVNITPNEVSVMLDFGAASGKEGLVATSGTIKRTGKKIEINVSGVTTSLDTKTITATINLGTVMDF